MLTPSFSALVFLLIYFSCISSFMKCNSYSLMFFHFLFLVVVKFCFLFKILYSTVTGRMKYMIKMRNYLFSITWLCLESFAKPGLRQRLKSLNCISDLLLPSLFGNWKRSHLSQTFHVCCTFYSLQNILRSKTRDNFILFQNMFSYKLKTIPRKLR